MAQEDREHEELANRLEKEADGLDQRSQELGQEIGDTRTDWHSKQADPGVPGAVEPSEESADEENETGDAPSGDRPDRRSST